MQGKLVCFSGTPCQVEGLKRFLGKEYENLICVDVVCRAVPSPLILKKYIEYQEKVFDDNIINVRFRDKHYGYKYSTMNIITKTKQKEYHQGIDSDPWLRAFFSNICDRPSCHECHFRKKYRLSDFTMWDCLNVYSFSKELDNDKGATRLLVHSDKGRTIFEEIKNEFDYVEIDSSKIGIDSKEMRESVEPHPKREEFFKDANIMNGYDLFNKYYPITFKVKLEHAIRMFFMRIGLYKNAKKLFVKITHKY